MTIQECYQQLGGDISEVQKRLPSVNLVKKFITKFLDDGSFSELCLAMEEGDREKAFRAAHTLKGVSANLSLNQLLSTVILLTEQLRTETADIPDEAYLFCENVKQDYALTVHAIRTFLDSEHA